MPSLPANGPPEPVGRAALKRLAALAARLLGTADAQVTLVGDADGPAALALVSDGPLVVPDGSADDRLGHSGAYLAVPLVDHDDHTLGVLAVDDPGPRSWTTADVTMLGHLAEAVVTQLELTALAAEYSTVTLRLGLAMAAGGIGSYEWDLRTGRLTWDDQLAELFGYESAEQIETIDAFYARVHPDDVRQVARAMEVAVETSGEMQAEYRIVLPGGETRWITTRGRAQAGRPGAAGGPGAAVHLVGVAYDTTADRDGEARVTRVLERMSAAFYSLDRDWRFRYVNAEAERLLERSREELLGGLFWELFPAAVGEEIERVFRRSAETGEREVFETYYPAPLDGWYEIRVWPGPDGLAVYFLDITERHRAREQAERSAARLDLLVRISAAFAEELDPEAAVAQLAHLTVPALADWCLVSLVDDGGRVRDVGWWHRDPMMRPVTERYSQLRIAALMPTSYVAQALRSGQPVVVEDSATEGLHRVLRPGETHELIDRLRPESAAIFPLRARGRTVGVLSLFLGPKRAPFDPQALATAREVAVRAGLGIDNALLYREQQHIAEGLQRSLLTAPPRPDDLDIAVRYVPAAAVAQVGGDWYDAFLQPGGATVVTIGDVVGHDTAAAAAMGQVRTLLRGIAYTTDDPPGRVLTRLDEAVHGLAPGTIATAVVARVERAGGGVRLRWSNAGHPPPLVLSPDGRATVLTEGRPNLLLGIDPRTRRTEAEVDLVPGSTVLLYTDGLVERRDRDVQVGIEILRHTLEELAGRSPEELSDEVLGRMLQADPQDDVALVAVRLRP